jgi:hypothetical protein
MSTIGPFTIESANGSEVVIKRPHPNNPAAMMWNVIKPGPYNSNEVAFWPIGDGTGGVVTNPYVTSLLQSDNADNTFITTGYGIYIFATEYLAGFGFAPENLSFREAVFCSYIKPENPESYLGLISNVDTCPYMHSGFRYGNSGNALYQTIGFKAGSSIGGKIDFSLGVASYIEQFIAGHVGVNSGTIGNWGNNPLPSGGNGIIATYVPAALPIAVNDSGHMGNIVGHYDFAITNFSNVASNMAVFTNSADGIDRLSLSIDSSYPHAFIKV